MSESTKNKNEKLLCPFCGDGEDVEFDYEGLYMHLTGRGTLFGGGCEKFTLDACREKDAATP